MSIVHTLVFQIALQTRFNKCFIRAFSVIDRAKKLKSQTRLKTETTSFYKREQYNPSDAMLALKNETKYSYYQKA